MFYDRTRKRWPFNTGDWLIEATAWACLTELCDTYHDGIDKKSLKIPKGQSESVYRRGTDNTIARRKSTKGQTKIYKTYI
jgi:hypothetical protein